MMKRKKGLFSDPSAKTDNNRISIIMAIIFLLGLSVIYKLYDLQIRNFDLYSALATSQHQISSQLAPDRGDIYIRDFSDNNQNLFPLAADKDFAHVFVVPKDIEDPQGLAEIAYQIFKKESVEEEVEKLLSEQEELKREEELNFIASWPAPEREAERQKILDKYSTLEFNREYQELKQLKREAEIEKRKNEITEKYLSIFLKKNDPYEPLENKVDEEVLLDFYAHLLSGPNHTTLPAELKLENGKIIFKADEEKKPVEIEGVGHSMKSFRYYPENNLASHLLGFVREKEDEQEGNYGLEGFFNKDLAGQPGSVFSERSADRRVIILNDREYVKPQNGLDLVLTIDRSVEFMVCRILAEAVENYAADGGSVIVLNPDTGAIVAMCSAPDFDPNNYSQVKDISVFNNPAIFNQYEPGSVFKSITMAAAINEGKVTPESTYLDEGFAMIEGWPKPIKNSDYQTFGAHGEVNMNNVLELSLNTGAMYAMKQIGPEKFAEYVKNFGFGEKTGIELQAESPGDIRNLSGDKVHEIYASTASFGQGMTVTSLQMVAAYAVLANGGHLMQPFVVKEIIYPDGTVEEVKPREVRQVISERTATLVSGMLANVVESGHAKLAAVPGYYVGGKTGTAQVASASVKGYGSATIQSFIGYAPISDPKFVMLVKLDNPKNSKYAASSAAPLFSEMAKFLLNYYQVPKER